MWSPDLGFATVFGFDADIDAVDLLHTSLLVQAHRAMALTEPPGGKAGRAGCGVPAVFPGGLRGADRRAADRRRARLRSPRPPDPAAGGCAVDLLPVLASRDEQVRETMRSVSPARCGPGAAGSTADEGWDSGRAAADHAALHLHAGR